MKDRSRRIYNLHSKLPRKTTVINIFFCILFIGYVYLNWFVINSIPVGFFEYMCLTTSGVESLGISDGLYALSIALVVFDFLLVILFIMATCTYGWPYIKKAWDTLPD